MLVLSRKAGQTIVIGENVTITVSKIVGGRVKIGIEAPKDLTVRRGELTATGHDQNNPTNQPQAA